MMNSFYTSATSLIEMQKGFDVTSNNIANANTTGYRSSDPTFADLMYSNINAAENVNSELKSGHGTKLNKTNIQFAQGEFSETNRDLDYAISNPYGFFAVKKDGQVHYTRNGNFQLSLEQGKKFLTASDGAYVLDPKGNPIAVTNEKDNLDVGVYTFPNCGALERVGDSSFAATAGSGAAAVMENPELKKGWTEGSNVDMAETMVSMIELQRAFQMNSKMVQISDEVTQAVNSLR